MMVANLTLKYSLFAVFATLANLLTQEIFLHLYVEVSALIIAMVAGTVVGWVSKYLLDKHYIFTFETSSQRENLLKFLTYGLTGILTTSIFWGFELVFDYLFDTKLARYLGAVIGLSIGYVVKYHLDKRYVFLEQES